MKTASRLLPQQPVGSRFRFRHEFGAVHRRKGLGLGRFSILPRIAKCRRDAETCHFRGSARAWNQRRDARVRFVEIEKQDYAPVHHSASVIEPMLAQQKDLRVIENNAPAERLGNHGQQYCLKMGARLPVQIVL